MNRCGRHTESYQRVLSGVVPSSAAERPAATQTIGRWRVRGIERFLCIVVAGCTPATSDAPRLVELTISPHDVTLESSGTQTFSIAALWTGGEGEVAPIFSATGGTISGEGVYTAGSTAGAFIVIVRDSNSGLADTARVTVSATEPPPPPPPPPVANCASPAAHWLFCDDFDQDRSASYFEAPTASGSFVRAAGVGRDGTSGMRARFAQGQMEAGGLHLAFGRTPQSYMRPAFTPTVDYREIYWRIYLRLAPGWTGGGGDKLTRATVFASSTSFAQAMVANVWSGSQASSDRDYLVLDPARGTTATGTLVTTQYNDFANLTWLGAQRSGAVVFAGERIGEWQCLEFRVRLNDAGQSNGSFTFWRNGVEEATRTGLNWLGSYGAYGINAIYIENYWNAGAPQVQERYFDDFVVGSAKIGC